MSRQDHNLDVDPEVLQKISSRRDSYVAAHDINIHIESTNDSRLQSDASRPSREISSILPHVDPLVGRKNVLKALESLLSPYSKRTPNVTLITGQPGVGKTALANHAVRAAVETGKISADILFVDFRGHDPDSTNRLTSMAAIDTLLRQLGAHSDEIPLDANAREEFFHSKLAQFAARSEQIIIIADNVADYSDVQSLLPRTALHRAVVTSRYTMPELNGKIIELDVLTMSESVKLLQSIIKTRARNVHKLQRDALEELACLCGHLPLALCLAAGRLVIEPHLAVTDLIDELSDKSSLLKGLTVGNRAVLAVFQTSYERLTGDQARMVRLFYLQHGPQFSVPMAAATLGTSHNDAKRIMSELCRAHLINPGTASGFYSVHDMIYSFAAELVEAEDDVDSLREASQRLFKYWFNTAIAAAAHLEETTPPNARSGPFANYKESLTWLDLVSSSMVPLVRMAYNARHNGFAILLGPSFSTYLMLRRRHMDLYEVSSISVAAAQEMTEQGVKDGSMEFYEAAGLNHAGIALREMRRYEEAIRLFERAQSLYESMSSRSGIAQVIGNLGVTYELLGRAADAIKCHIQDAKICRQTGDMRGYLGALINLGLAYIANMQPRESVRVHRKACEIAFATDSNDCRIKATNGLGISYRDIGHYEKSVRCHCLAKFLSTSSGDDYQRAVSCYNLAQAELAVRNIPSAILELNEAYSIFEHHGDLEAAANAEKILDIVAQTLDSFGEFLSED
jgi:tetratricopeptide (TPR) repeat protein